MEFLPLHEALRLIKLKTELKHAMRRPVCINWLDDVERISQWLTH
jgi:hypothetical protein